MSDSKLKTPTGRVVSPQGGAPKRRKIRYFTGRDKVVLSLMVGIPTLIQLALVWLPALGAVILSFTKINGVDVANATFVGGQNYSFIANDLPSFWPALLHNLYWLLSLGIVATPIGLLLAVVLNQNLRGSRIYQSIFFGPVMVSLALVGVIWELMYQQQNGLINNLMGNAGPQGINWLGNPDLTLWSGIIAAAWRHAGYIMLLYLAGLKGIDVSVQEAAQIDGAGPWRTFFFITLPMMRGSNIIVVVITFIESMRAFDIAWVLNKGTNGLELLSTLIVQNLIGEGADVGTGSAIATVLMVVCLIPITIYLVRVFKKDFS